MQLWLFSKNPIKKLLISQDQPIYLKQAPHKLANPSPSNLEPKNIASQSVVVYFVMGIFRPPHFSP